MAAILGGVVVFVIAARRLDASFEAMRAAQVQRLDEIRDKIDQERLESRAAEAALRVAVASLRAREPAPGGTPASGGASIAEAPIADGRPAAGEPEPARETDEQRTAYAAGQHVLEEALARGVWSEGDRARLQALGGSMSPEQLGEIGRAIAVAVNAQSLKLDYAGNPF